MRTRLFAILCLILLPCSWMQAKNKGGGKVFTGISGAVSVHGGYLFSQSPDQLLSNTNLGDVTNLKKDGLCYGFGAQLRIHFIDHIHMGAEANLSNMPLMSNGSNVSSVWAGGFVDGYLNLGKTKPLVGLGIGGGQTKRLYIPTAGAVEQGSTTYNSSYTQTPFFYLDPYIGLETDFGLLGFQFKIDYLLPFGNPSSNLVDMVKSANWGNFMAPSGIRLHLALVFGKL